MAGAHGFSDVISSLEASCCTEARTVAEMLEEIAANGDGSNDAEFLIACLRDLIDWAEAAIDWLRERNPS